MESLLSEAQGRACSEPFATLSLSKTLARRLRLSLETLARDPSRSLPTIFSAAGYKAFSRMLHNPRLHEAPLFEAVYEATRRACTEESVVVIAHDTTEVRFGGATRRPGLGRINTHDQGFLCHVSLAVTAQGPRRVLGAAQVYSWVRPDAHAQGMPRPQRERREHTEGDRWLQGVQRTATLLGPEVARVHVGDRESDEYEFMAELRAQDERFVLRQRQARNIVVAPSETEAAARKSTEAVRRAPLVGSFTVPVQTRVARGQRKRDATHPPRTARTATLVLQATTVQVQRPHDAARSAPASLTLNVVSLRELDPPAGEDPIVWTLLTSEPIETEEQVQQIVRWYTRRWLVEEWFKGLKTGCALEQRQLEGYEALQVYLALTLPLATHLVNVRTAVEEDPSQPAEALVDPDTLAVLRISDRYRWPAKPTARDLLLAIAAMGGHFRHNGPPGWLVLLRGRAALQQKVEAFRWGLAEAEKRANKIRGQS